MIVLTPERTEFVPEITEKERFEKLGKFFEKPNANPKIKGTDLKYKKDEVLSELDEIALQLIDALPDQINPNEKDNQSLEEQFQHLMTRHCDAATSEIGETTNKEIKFPGIYDHSLNISMEKVGNNEISTTFELLPA